MDELVRGIIYAKFWLYNYSYAKRRVDFIGVSPYSRYLKLSNGNLPPIYGQLCRYRILVL